ncbi:hypothetical protein [Micromonospora sp. C41]|uniref:hypothetical protein n=1 Tax=Micromonospora sp. C41 TaxID=2824878 RepID=UPI001B35B801|nr:hypothetical protein [Micromonospora sp. C41]MBQ1061329.1 hypothetical protein [Micromonospora sp. C41]
MDKELLFKPRCKETDVELEGVGVVRLRGLTRVEVKTIGEGVNDGKDMEAQALAWALVDPQLTVDEVRRLFEVASFGEIQLLNETVNELSGIAGLAQKEAYKSAG